MKTKLINFLILILLIVIILTYFQLSKNNLMSTKNRENNQNINKTSELSETNITEQKELQIEEIKLDDGHIFIYDDKMKNSGKHIDPIISGSTRYKNVHEAGTSGCTYFSKDIAKCYQSTIALTNGEVVIGYYSTEKFDQDKSRITQTIVIIGLLET